MDIIFASILSAIVGAFGSVIPVWITLRKSNAELRQQHGELLLQLKKGEAGLKQEDIINTEASWKRILNEKDKEVLILRARTDEQDKKLDDLLTRHIDCKQSEARQEERAKNLSERCDRQSGDVKALTNKVLLLENLLRGNQSNVNQQSGSGTHVSLPIE